MANRLSINIDVLLKGAEEINKLAQSLRALKGSTSGVSSISAATRGLADDQDKAAAATLRLAQAQARQQTTAKNYQAAIKTLTDALKGVDPASVQAVRAQTQLLNIQTQAGRAAANTGKTIQATAKAYETSASAAAKNEAAMIRQAQAFARLQQIAGNTPGAIQTLNNALAQAVNPNSLAAIRAQIQKTYLDTNYANSPLIGAIRQITGGLQGLAPVLGRSGSAVQSFVGVAGSAGNVFSGIAASAGTASVAIGGVVAAGLGLLGLVSIGEKVISVLQRIAETGIGVNSGFEQTRLGIASVVASVGKLNKNGVELTGVDALNAALPIASQQLDALRVDALQTALSFEQISKGFLQAVGPGLAAGLNLDQIRKTVIDLSQLVGPLTGQTEQLGQELRAIFSGDINQDTQVAKALQITREQVKAAKEAGTFAEFLNEKLKVAAATGALMSQTFEAAKSNLQEAGNILAAQVSEGLFSSLRNRINELLPQVFETAGGKVNITPAFKGIADTLTEIFDRVGFLAERVILFIVDGVKQISKFLDDNRAAIDTIIASAEVIVEQIAGIVLDIFRSIGFTTDWGKQTSTVATTLKIVAVALAGIREAIFLIRSAVFTVGSAIALAMLQPLRLATKAIAAILSFVPGLGNAAAGVVTILDNASASLEASVKNNGKAVADTIKTFGQAGRDALLDITNAPLAAKFRREARNFKQTLTGGGASLNPPKPEDKKKKDTTKEAESILASEKKLADARLALAKAFAERESDLTKAETDLQNRLLDQQLEDRQIGLTSFYNEKAKLIADDSQRELAAIQAAMTAERARIAEVTRLEREKLALTNKPAERKQISNEAEAERIQIQAKLVDLETKLSQAELKGAQQAEENARKRIAAVRALQGELESVAEQLLRVTGREFEASAADIQNRFADLLRRVVAEFGEQSAEAQTINALKAALTQEATIRSISREGEQRQAEFDFARTQVQNELVTGLISERAARERILELEKAFAAVQKERLDRQIEAQKALTGAESPEVLQLEIKRLELSQLGIDPIFRDIRNGLNNDLRGAFFSLLTDFGNGLESLKQFGLRVVDAFKNAIGRRLDAIIEKKIVEPAVNFFLSKILGFDTADVATTTNTVATNANTLALNANTQAQLAKSGQSVIDQVSSAGSFEIQAPTTAGGGETAAGAIETTLNKTQNLFQKFANSLKGIVSNIGGGLRSILSGLASFFGNIFGSLFGGLGGGGQKFSSLPKEVFAEGGYTGDGAKYQPAGIVHAGEYVMPANRVSQFGAGFFEAIRQGRFSPAMVGNYLSSLSGIAVRARSGSFASGGLAGSVSPVAAAPVAGAQSLRIVNVNDPAQAAEFLNSAAGEQVILNRISKSPQKWRAALKL